LSCCRRKAFAPLSKSHLLFLSFQKNLKTGDSAAKNKKPIEDEKKEFLLGKDDVEPDGEKKIEMVISVKEEKAESSQAVLEAEDGDDVDDKEDDAMEIDGEEQEESEEKDGDAMVDEVNPFQDPPMDDKKPVQAINRCNRNRALMNAMVPESEDRLTFGSYMSQCQAHASLDDEAEFLHICLGLLSAENKACSTALQALIFRHLKEVNVLDKLIGEYDRLVAKYAKEIRFMQLSGLFGRIRSALRVGVGKENFDFLDAGLLDPETQDDKKISSIIKKIILLLNGFQDAADLNNTVLQLSADPAAPAHGDYSFSLKAASRCIWALDMASRSALKTMCDSLVLARSKNADFGDVHIPMNSLGLPDAAEVQDELDALNDELDE